MPVRQTHSKMPPHRGIAFMNPHIVGKERSPMKPFLHRKVSVAVALVLLLAAGSTAFAAAQGDPLLIGLNNTTDLLTSIVGSGPTTMFRVINNRASATA